MFGLQDGVIYSFIIKDTKYEVKPFLEFDGPVAHLAFSPSYKMLLIQTDKVHQRVTS